MSDQIPAKKPAVRKSAAKSIAAKDKLANSPQQETPQPVADATEKKPFIRKEVGAPIFDKKNVPADFIEAAKNRFGRPGVAIDFRTARINGDYRGEVLNGDKFVAQQVSPSAVVFHQKSDVSFQSEKLKWRDENKSLNGANIGIYYNGDKASAYPHDPERENLAKLVNAIKKSAERLNLPDLESFKKNIETVQTDLWAQKVQERKKAEPAKERTVPQQEHSR